MPSEVAHGCVRLVIEEYGTTWVDVEEGWWEQNKHDTDLLQDELDHVVSDIDHHATIVDPVDGTEIDLY